MINQPTIHFITIIMAVRNEEKHIRACLENIFNQKEVPAPYEVIVADGISTDGTREIIFEMQSTNPNLILIDNPGVIVPTGLNQAIRIAKGNIIVRVDGHTKIAPDYVKSCIELLNTTRAENVGGRMVAIGRTAFGRAVAVATSTPFGVGGSRFHYSEKEEEVDSVYLGAWPKDVFLKIGLFDEEMVRDQDDEFNYRLREHGGKIILSPSIKSEYTVRSTPKTLWKQYFQYGFWKVRVLQKHPLQMSLRQFIPPAFALTLVGTIILGLFFAWGRILLASFLACYLVANLTASVISASRKGRKQLLLLPPAFAILHLSYGSGFLIGLVKFWNRWRDKKGKVPELAQA